MSLHLGVAPLDHWAEEAVSPAVEVQAGPWPAAAAPTQSTVERVGGSGLSFLYLGLLRLLSGWIATPVPLGSL